MSNIVGKKSGLVWAVHISVFFLVALWLMPTVGLFVSSFRTADQIATSGWWNSLFAQEQNLILRSAAPSTQRQEGEVYIIDGNIFADNGSPVTATISAWGTSSRAISDFQPGDTAPLGDGAEVLLQENGDYRIESPTEMSGSRGERLFVTAEVPPEFTLQNYDTVDRKSVV